MEKADCLEIYANLLLVMTQLEGRCMKDLSGEI